jgi:hypothetical protein
MSPTVEALCCVPVLLLWLGPLALVAFYGVCAGHARLARLSSRGVVAPAASGNST